MPRVVTSLVLLFAVACSGVNATNIDRSGARSTRTFRGRAAELLVRASAEIPCPTGDLALRDIGAGGYQVEGCFTRVTYTCHMRACVLNERATLLATNVAGRPATDTGPRARGTWTDQHVTSLRTGLHDHVVGCLPPDVHRVRLQLSISASGAVRRVGEAPVPEAAAACIDDILARGHMRGAVTSARFVWLEFERASTQGADASHDAPLGPDRAARAAVDARAPSILACVEEAALSFELSWSAEGRLDAALRGTRRGTPEDACVRAIVQQLGIPAPGTAGTIVHAIQR